MDFHDKLKYSILKFMFLIVIYILAVIYRICNILKLKIKSSLIISQTALVKVMNYFQTEFIVLINKSAFALSK